MSISPTFKNFSSSSCEIRPVLPSSEELKNKLEIYIFNLENDWAAGLHRDEILQIRSSIEEILDDPGFKNNSYKFIDNLNNKRKNTEELVIPDDYVMAFFDKYKKVIN